jgi:hypothetical protein
VIEGVDEEAKSESKWEWKSNVVAVDEMEVGWAKIVLGG